MYSALPGTLRDLDPALYQPDPAALDFLHATIAQDDAELKERVIQTQNE